MKLEELKNRKAREIKQMQCLINDYEIIPTQLSYRIKGFGRNIPDEIKLKFEIILSIDEFEECFETTFNRYIIDCKEDDEKYGDAEILDIKKFGYPNFKQALKNQHELIKQLLKKNLAIEFLDKCLPQNDNSQFLYGINSIDEIIITTDKIKVIGIGFHKK